MRLGVFRVGGGVELRAQHGADGVRPVPRDGFRGLREPSESAAAKLAKENLGCFLAQRCTPPGQTVTRRIKASLRWSQAAETLLTCA